MLAVLVTEGNLLLYVVKIRRGVASRWNCTPRESGRDRMLSREC